MKAFDSSRMLATWKARQLGAECGSGFAGKLSELLLDL